MGKHSSPSRLAFKARRAEARANDPAVQQRRLEWERKNKK